MSIAAIASTVASAPAPAAPPDKDAGAWDFSFKNLLDIVNPLQHIPIVSTLYRKLTGDVPATPEKIAGDALYGGPVGFFSSLADSAFEALTGKDFADTVLSFFTGGGNSAPAMAQAALPSEPSGTSAAPLSAMSNKSADGDTARRAAVAYGRSITMTDALANAY